MASTTSFLKLFIFFFLICNFLTSTQASTQSNECVTATNSCTNKDKALRLKIIAIFSILIASVIGVCSPLFTRSIPMLHPDRNMFIILKAFSAGIILATGFMHVLPDSFAMLWSNCLKENPWHKFPFSGFVAMISAIITLMIDSMATSFYTKKHTEVMPENSQGEDQESPAVNRNVKEINTASQLSRYRIIAMVLEFGIVVHSVVIGLSLGATNDTCTIKGLVAALCFHQMFEGMGLGGCILQAEYKQWMKRAIMVFFFSVTTPFGIVLGIGLSRTYKENSPNALITVGLLNASSAGLLIYMALVDLLSADFMGPKLQSSIKLQLKSCIAVLLGAGGMSLMAKWA